MKKQLLKALLPLTLVAAMLPVSAMATCTMVGGVGYVDMSFGSVSAPDSAAIGSVLATQNVTFHHGDDNNGSYHCDSNGGKEYNWTNKYGTVYGPPVSGLAHTYATNVPGVGFQLVENGYFFDNPPGVYSAGPNTGTGFDGIVFTIKLIKTAKTTKGGALTTGEVSNVMLDSGQKDMVVRLNGGTIVNSSH